MSLLYGVLEGGNSGKNDCEDCYLILKVKNLDLNLVGFRLVDESSDNSIRQTLKKLNWQEATCWLFTKVYR